MDISFEQAKENIRVVDQKRNYWFIRSYGGELYNYFIENGFVGFGFNNVPMSYIQEASKENNPSGYTQLKKFIESNSEYKGGEATKWANQLIQFERDINIGDIIILPSKGSDELYFGVVKSNTYLSDDKKTFQFNDKYEAYPEKRKKVEWLKEIPKRDLQELKPLFSSHQGVTNADWFSQFIEGSLTSVYIKEDKVYLSIKIDQDEDINAFDLSRFLESLTYFYTEFAKENGEDVNEDLFIKIRVQSKGKILLRALSVAGVLGIAGMIALSNNNELKLEIGDIRLQGKNEGFLKSISDFQDASEKRRQEKEMFIDSMKNLKAKTIESQDSILKEKISKKVEEKF